MLKQRTALPIAGQSGESRMTLSKVEATFCERELGELVRTSSGVEAALIATGDGFEVACVSRAKTVDAARVSGLASSVLALAKCRFHLAQRHPTLARSGPQSAGRCAA